MISTYKVYLRMDYVPEWHLCALPRKSNVDFRFNEVYYEFPSIQNSKSIEVLKMWIIKINEPKFQKGSFWNMIIFYEVRPVGVVGTTQHLLAKEKSSCISDPPQPCYALPYEKIPAHCC